jgi:hypothetical protein
MAEEQYPNDAKASRREACELLGLGDDPSRLCPADRLKVDLVSTLRLVIDHAGEVVRGGGTADLGRLVAAVEHLTRLRPAAREPPPTRDDPRETMFKIYMEMRERGEVPPEGWFRHRISELETKVAELEAALAAEPVPAGAASPPQPESPPAPSNVVPLSKSPNAPAAAAPAPRPAAPAYELAPPEPWRSFQGGAHYDRWSNRNIP